MQPAWTWGRKLTPLTGVTATVEHQASGCLNRSLLSAQIRILSKSTGQSIDKLEKDISRPRYFNPYDAIDYGIIDKVSIPWSLAAC